MRKSYKFIQKNLFLESYDVQNCKYAVAMAIGMIVCHIPEKIPGIFVLLGGYQ